MQHVLPMVIALDLVCIPYRKAFLFLSMITIHSGSFALKARARFGLPLKPMSSTLNLFCGRAIRTGCVVAFGLQDPGISKKCKGFKNGKRVPKTRNKDFGYDSDTIGEPKTTGSRM